MATQRPVSTNDMPLLRTKLFVPPPRPETVSRPRLIERLNGGLARKLTLISAPAGFGKTTLVSEWVHALGEGASPSAGSWISLDEGDNDATRFLTYVVAALQARALDSDAEGVDRRASGNLGAGVMAMLRSPQPPPTESMLTALLNDILAFPTRWVLVLDDYHLIQAQAIHDILNFLLRHLPPPISRGLHLVIVTREDPLLPLARLRARGQLNELRAADLRFTHTEAADLLNRAMGLGLSEENVAALETRTEGWVAGLQLAALGLQGTVSQQGLGDVAGFIESFTGSHRFVLDYLVEEVLQQQPKRVQEFLLRTSILERLSGPLCDAVLWGAAGTPGGSPTTLPRAVDVEEPGGQATLEHLDHANLFVVPLDAERRWYRYHHLFADLLRRRLRHAQPELLPALHTRASLWCEQNAFVDEAIEHALRAEDFERVAHLIEAQVDAIWARGEHAKLRRWLDNLPAELLLANPQLSIFHALYLFTGGQHEAAERMLQAVERALDPPPSAEEVRSSESDRRKLRGRLAAARALIYSYVGDVPRMIPHARLALEDLPESDLAMRGLTAIALGDAYAFKGDMVAAHEAQREALDVFVAAGDIYFPVVVNLKLANTARARGRLQQTSEICRVQTQYAQERGLSQMVAAGCLLAIWGEALAELDDLDTALDLAQQGLAIAERGGNMAMLGWSYLCLIRILFSRGDVAGAQQLIQRLDRLARQSDVPGWVTEQMSCWQVRLWLVQDNLSDASRWVEERDLDIDEVLDPSREMDLSQLLDYTALFDYLVLARILLARHRLGQAAELLRRLLKAAEAGGRGTRMIEIRMLQALVRQAGDDTDTAMDALERALALAEPEGFVRAFVDEGPAMAQLLYEALSRGIAPGYIRRLLSAFPAEAPASPPLSEVHRPSSDLFEPLSDRELEVLQLIAEGLTNREIATRLFLSSHTIKTHTRNIYGKLDAHSRTQAVTRAQALGILPTG